MPTLQADEVCPDVVRTHHLICSPWKLRHSLPWCMGIWPSLFQENGGVVTTSAQAAESPSISMWWWQNICRSLIADGWCTATWGFKMRLAMVPVNSNHFLCLCVKRETLSTPFLLPWSPSSPTSIRCLQSFSSHRPRVPLQCTGRWLPKDHL